VGKLLLETGEKAWQPQDFVPDLTQENWVDGGCDDDSEAKGTPPSCAERANVRDAEVKEFREMAESLPDETLVVSTCPVLSGSQMILMICKSSSIASQIASTLTRRDVAAQVLVGDMVTEEALPTYQTLLNTFEGG
jgi:hypothetical protein